MKSMTGVRYPTDPMKTFTGVRHPTDPDQIRDFLVSAIFGFRRVA